MVIETTLTVETTLTKVLSRGAFFAETHSIKGWLAARRLKKRFTPLAGSLEDLNQWNQLLTVPVVRGLLSSQVEWDLAALDDRRLHYMMRGAVFPMAYAVAVEWVRRHSLADLINRDSDAALRRLGNLGHSFTIHKSFVEVLDFVEGVDQERLCAERYAEFVASQLAEIDAVPENTEPLDGPAQDLRQVAAKVFQHPGYLGHTAISLAYLLRYRAELGEAKFGFGLGRVSKMAVPYHHDASDIEVAKARSDLSAHDLAEAIQDLVTHGPREVHTLTLADAVCDLWDKMPEQRVETEALTRRFAKVALARSGGGERADD
jgi:hypothetical protein